MGEFTGDVIDYDESMSKPVPMTLENTFFQGLPSWEPDGRKCPHCGSANTRFFQYGQTTTEKLPQRIIVGVAGIDFAFEVLRCFDCKKGFVEEVDGPRI